MDLTQTLSNCQNPNLQARQEAENALKQAAEQNLGAFMLALVGELASEEKDENGRTQAGLYLKLLLTGTDSAILDKKLAAYAAVDASTKAQIRAGSLQTLMSPVKSARHTSAQVVGSLGAIELPENQWPELLPALLNNVTGQFPDEVKVATLEALGYMCEDWGEEAIDQAQTDQILTSIVDGIRKDRTDPIRLAAATALRNSLEFIKGNMNNEQERNMIMQVICEATQSEDINVRMMSYECLSNIAQLYYEFLSPYMQALFQLTCTSIQTDDASVGMQAIEFWSTLCEEEMVILDEMMEAEDAGQSPDRTCSRYVEGALPTLCPLLMETLTKQDEDADDDDWNISMAGATCLGLMAQCVEDKIVEHTMPFITGNIQNENWRLREAATMAFGSILEGPSSEVLQAYVAQALPVLINATQDQHVMVKDTTVWTLGMICDLHAKSISAEVFQSLVGALMVNLDDAPRVASQACFALHNLAEAFEDSVDAPTNGLSAFFGNLIGKLLQVTERSDWSEHNLRVGAYEAVNTMIRHAAVDVRPIVVQILPVILERLQNTFTMQVLTTEDKEEQQGLQALLCGNIQICCMVVDDQIKPFADKIMELLLTVFQSKNAIAHEEAFMAAGALADKMEGEFQKYMSHFHPCLLMGLRTYEEYQVCTVAVGVVGDICRALEAQVLPFCDDIVRCLLENLQNPELNRSVKPPVLSAFGDIALAISGQFEKYLQVTMMMLAQASMTQFPDDNEEELIDYLNLLREGVLEAYTGIVQGLKTENKQEHLIGYLDGIAAFLQLIASDENRDESVVQHAVGVIGDLGDALGSRVYSYVTRPFVATLLQDGQTGTDKTREICDWTNSIIMKIAQNVPRT
mmetsp:Transcript_1337/g.1780  ORF Transcript_1337/g.1780 Transcript_1337/m.1780 type:complete len:860 (+) Transcript_1337:100-2679(+)